MSFWGNIKWGQVSANVKANLGKFDPKPAFKSWPVSLDQGAETQFTQDEYSRPSARVNIKPGVKKSAEVEQSNDEDKHKRDSNNGSDHKVQHQSGESANRNSSGDQYIPSESQFFDPPDLKIVLDSSKGARFIFFVSSHALCLASKAWKMSINPGPFKELEQEEQEYWADSKLKTLNLEDDDPEALSLIFSIIHLRSEVLPSDIPYNLLHKLAVVCDKYECGRAVQPWGSIWLAKHAKDSTSVGYENWIFIAKVLDPRLMGAKAISSALIIQSSSTSLDRTYMLRCGSSPGVVEHEVELKFIPDDILNYIIEERDTAVEKIVVLLRKFVSEVSAHPVPLLGSHICNDPECLDIALGSLIRSLKKRNLWPLLKSKEPQQWHGPISQLVERIENIQMTTLIPKKERTNKETTPAVQTSSAQSTSASSVGISSSPSESMKSAQETRIYIGKCVPTPTTDTKESQNVKDHDYAYTVERLRFTAPAFHQYSFAEEHLPCKSAFLLGKLITDCQNIVRKLAASGYEVVKSAAPVVTFEPGKFSVHGVGKPTVGGAGTQASGI